MKLIPVLLGALAFVASVGQFPAAAEGKKAVLMVHFGSTNDDTRVKTIDALNHRVADSFPDRHVAEAYVSSIVMKRLAAKGVKKDNLQQALLKLAAAGYEEVTLQPSFMLDGIVSKEMQKKSEQMEPFFKKISIGAPLLYSIDDSRFLASLLAERYAAKGAGKRDHVVFVGHGSPDPANAVYSQIDHMLHASGHDRFHVATIEGYPEMAELKARLKAAGARKVTLVPLLFVAGDHANNDIAADWAEELRGEGYEVEAVVEGLGEIPAVRDRYIEHLRAAEKGLDSHAD